MAEHEDPGNKSQDQVQEEAWLCFRLRAEGCSYEEITQQTKLSRSTIIRRLSILEPEVHSRDFLKAASNYRLDQYTRVVLRSINEFSPDPGNVARLAATGAQLERRRAALNGLDEPTASRVTVNNTTPSDFGGRKPVWATDDMERWRQSDLYRADLTEAGRELDD